jgi:FAD/FMN-containing dehydrogenase
VLHLAGALNARAADDGAVGNRTARFFCGIKGMWAPDEPNADIYRQWVHDAWQQLRPYSTGATYINFQTQDEDESRIRATYGSNLPRLQGVKQHYDPHNLFRVNRNIRPQQ